MNLNRIGRHLVRKREVEVNPTFLVSFPRSGSNYVQKVLMDSQDLPSVSIYKDEIKRRGARNPARRGARNLKSHAISPEYLLDELNFLSQPVSGKISVITLHRDPRDVMISFYNYYLAKGHEFVSQGDFMDTDWFLAVSKSGNAKTHLRNIHTTPMSIKEAYTCWVNSWCINRSHDLAARALSISYEESVSDPEKTVRQLVKLHGSEYKNKEVKVKLVALHSDENRPRGVSHGWKQDAVYNEYKTLINAVEVSFDTELNFFGYNT